MCVPKLGWKIDFPESSLLILRGVAGYGSSWNIMPVHWPNCQHPIDAAL